MHIEELYQAVSNMAVVAQHLKEDAENAVQIQQQVAYQLEQRLQVLDESIETALARHVEKLREQVAQQVADGSQDSMQDFQQQLEDLKKQMLDFSQFAAMIKKDLNKVSRHSQLYLIKIWQLNKKGHNPTLKDTRQDNPKERQLCPKTNLSLKRI